MFDIRFNTIYKKAMAADMTGETAKNTEGIDGINDIMFGAINEIPTNRFGTKFWEVLLAKQKQMARNTLRVKNSFQLVNN